MYFMKRVFGKDQTTCYLTRFKLFPMMPWGQPYLHVFHRGDYDRSFHDHPYDFWTFPLKTYYERVLNLTTGEDRVLPVKAWRLHFRPAEYTHIQMGSATGPGYSSRFRDNYNGPTVTLLWRKHTRRKWGFWKHHLTSKGGLKVYHWTHWRDYDDSGSREAA